MFNKNNYILYNKDCRKQLIELKNKNIIVDSIITDPPYNISKDNNFHTLTNATRQGIHFGDWDVDFDLFSWIDDADKILKKGGSFIIFNSFLNIGNLAKKLESLGYQIKDVIRWVKNNPMPRNMQSRYVADYEFAIWCVKGKSKWTFNNQSTGYLRPEYKIPLTPKSERINHPTQKPLALMSEIIKVHTNKGDIILDPFMGSGSTGIAAISLERKFIGIEFDKDYYKETKKRFDKFKQ